MNTSGLNRHPVSKLLIACAALTLLLSACQPANASTSLPPAQPTTDMPVVQATQPATQPTAAASSDISLDLSSLAQSQTVETVAAVSASAGGPWWEAMPAYRLVTLQGYPVANHQLKPQIFIYPAAGLAPANAAAGKTAADLQALLQTKQPGGNLPYLPLVNAKQVIHPQLQYLDFKNGKGARFLTWYSQGLGMINNAELTYTFQGLTSDGKYYIAVVLPVTHPDLPAAAQASPQVGAEYLDYVTKTAAMLSQQLPASFTPDLSKLDALVQSIQVK